MVFKLQELINLEKGEILNPRVVDSQGPKIETCLSSSGKYNKVDISDMATYWFIPSYQGALCGQGRGLVMRQDDEEMATWTGMGVAKFTGPAKKMTITGSLLYHTDSIGKLAPLNNLMAVFKFDVDENGNSVGTIWELEEEKLPSR